MTHQSSNNRLRPVIRVFVSSTFSDMKHERNALQANVFPKLEQLCLKHGFQFQAIDLRWGVSAEAGLDHRTMRICFDELGRAQEISPRPNFLILLGNRYGWRPLPEDISVEEFHALEQAAEKIPGSADRSAVVVLREWYREDTNAIPSVYLLQSRRQDLGDDQDYTDEAVWNQVQAVLWTIINQTMPPEQLQRRFDCAAADGPPPVIVRFQASATEQEIWHGALRVPDAREHVLAYFREIENLATLLDKDFIDMDPSGHVEVALQTEQYRLKEKLRRRLGSANVFRNEDSVRLVEDQDNQGSQAVDVTTDHLPQLCADVVSRLTEIIQGQIDEYWRNTPQASPDRATRELEIEQREYERFAKERGGEESFVGRQAELQAILDYVGSDSRWPLVIHGASGCGKTALLARASQEVANTRKRIERFIGVAPRSSDLRSLLSSLCQELRQRNPRADALPTEIKELRDEFSQHLLAATPAEPLILFLDALDQLADADNGRLLNWLPPGSLPAHVKFVLSCLSDRATGDPAGQPYAELKRRPIPAENFINLDMLSEAEARLLLFDRWLPKAGRKVNADQRARIEQLLVSPSCRQPIFLKLLFEEIRLWHSYDPAPMPGESVPALLGQFFDRLSLETNHGPLLVNRVLGYLSASRHGLAENEMLEILFADPEYYEKLKEENKRNHHELPSNAKRIPIALWSRLRFDLAPYLTERAAPGANVLTFYHRQVAEWVQEHFPKSSGQSWQPHQRLATYFQAQDYFLESLEKQRERAKRLPPTRRPANVRKVDELPWQQLEIAKLSHKWNDLARLFTEIFFLEAKVEAGLIFELATDFRQVLKVLPIELSQSHILKMLQEGISRDIHFINRHPTTLFQCLWNSCWWYDSPQSDRHYPKPDSGWSQSEPPWDQDKPKLHVLLESWRAYKAQLGLAGLWMRSLRPPPIPIDYGMVTMLPVDRSKALRFNEIIGGGAGNVSHIHFDGHAEVLWAWINTNSRDGIMCPQAWDLRSGVEIDTSAFPDAVCPRTQTSPDGQLTVGHCKWGAFHIVSVNDARTHYVVPLDEDQICREAVFSPSGDRMAYRAEGADCPSAVGIWCLNTNRKLFEFDLKESPWAIAFSNNGRWLAVGDFKGSVRIIDVNSGIVSCDFNTDGRCIDAIGISDDGCQCAIAVHGFVQLFRLPVSNRASNFISHVSESSEITEMLFSPDGNRLVTRSIFSTTILWKTDDGSCVGFLRKHGAYLFGGPPRTGTCLTNERVVSVNLDDISTYNAVDGSVISKEKISTDGDDRIIFTESGEHFLRISPEPRNHLFVFTSMQPVINQHLDSSAAVFVAIARPRSEEFICAHADGNINVWSIERNEPVRTIASGFAQIESVLCTPDGSKVIVQSAQGEFAVWNLDTCRLDCSWQLPIHSIQERSVDTVGIEELILSSDANYLVILYKEGMIEIFCVGSGKRIYISDTADSDVFRWLANNCYAFRRDGDTEIRNLSGGVYGWLSVMGWTLRSPVANIWAVAQDGQVYLFALEENLST